MKKINSLQPITAPKCKMLLFQGHQPVGTTALPSFWRTCLFLTVLSCQSLSCAPKSQKKPLDVHLNCINSFPVTDSRSARWVFEEANMYHKLSLKFWRLVLVGFWFSLSHASPKVSGVGYLYLYIFTSSVALLFEKRASRELCSVVEQCSVFSAILSFSSLSSNCFD